MSLAQRLNELASAHAAGLLNDDEYRLLRQGAFTQYPEVESPSLSTFKARSASFMEQKRFRVVPNRHLGSPSRETPTRRANPLTSGVSFILRYITLQRPENEERLQRSDPLRLASFLSNLSRVSTQAIDTPSVARVSEEGTARSPLQARKSGACKRSRLIITNHESGTRPSIDGVLQESNLCTAQEIRCAIVSLNREMKKLIEAFNLLEISTAARIYDLPVYATQGQSSTRPPQHATAPRLSNRPSVDTGDRHSISASCGKTSLPLSLSASSLRGKQSLGSSRLQRHHPPTSALQCENSVSLISDSRVTPRFRLGNETLSHSTGHLPSPLERDFQISAMQTMDMDEGDLPSELAEIRRRKKEMISRCEARLEYLRARLKGAELHEKVIRR